MYVANPVSSLCASVQALLHAREYPTGPLNVDDPRDLTLNPPLLPARHSLASPPQSWLTGTGKAQSPLSISSQVPSCHSMLVWFHRGKGICEFQPCIQPLLLM